MANPENKNFGERAGEGVRNVGFVIAALGLIGLLVEMPTGKLALGGAGLAVSGEIFRRVSKKK